VRLTAIATAAEQIKAKSFTIDGEAVVLGPDGLSRFEELRSREASHAAILYAFDLKHDGEDMRIAHSSTARLRWRDSCAILRLASGSMCPRRDRFGSLWTKLEAASLPVYPSGPPAELTFCPLGSS
jgi:hypothetical protein